MAFVDCKTSAGTPRAYNELKAQGFEVEQKNGQYFVKIDGVSIQIYEYDTIWTVKARRDAIASNNNNEEKLQQQLSNLKEEFQMCLDRFDECLKNMKMARVDFSKFLRNNNAQFLSDLKGTNAYDTGKVKQEAKYSTSAAETAALGAVLRTNNQIQSVCSELRYLA